LEAACSRLSASDEDAQDELLSASLSQLLGPARAVEVELAAIASGGQQSRREGRDRSRAGIGEGVRAAGSSPAGRIQAHDRPERQHDALAGVGRDLASLPGLVSRLLLAEPLAVTTGHVQAAQQAVTERRERLTAVTQGRDKAAEELAEFTVTQRQLDHRRRREVTDPLHALANYLEQWQYIIEQAVSVLPGNWMHIPIPDRPEAITEHHIGACAAALAEADRQARDQLSQAVADADMAAS